jgi:hypothetical protein
VAIDDSIESDLNDVGVLKLLAIHFAVIDERSVGAGQILKEQNFLDLDDSGMVSGNGRIVQAQIIIGLSPYRERRPAYLDLLRYALRRFHNQARERGAGMRHDRPPLLAAYSDVEQMAL